MIRSRPPRSEAPKPIPSQVGSSLPLNPLLHVAGAMILVGGLVTAGAASVLSQGDSSGTLARFSYLTLAAVAFPGFVLMRIGAAWIYDKVPPPPKSAPDRIRRPTLYPTELRARVAG